MQIRNIQILRGVAAIAVLFYHINIWEAKFLAGHTITPVFFSWGFSGVDLFFVISGFIMVFIQPAPLDSRTSYLRFMINRLTRIYPPVWLVMLALLPVWLMHPEYFNHYCGNHVDIFRSFFLLPQDYTPLLGVAWTLTHEVYFYLVVSLALRFGPRGRWMFGCAWFLIVLVTFSLFKETEFYKIRILQQIFSPFSMTFLLGYFIGLAFNQIRKIPSPLAVGFLLTGIFSLALGCIMPWPYDIGGYPDNNNLHRFLVCGLSAALLVTSAVALEARLPQPVLRLGFFGDISYALYLTHLPFICAYYIVLSKLHLTSPWEILGALVICVASCLMLATLFHFYLELKLTRKCRQLLEKYFQL